MQATVRIKGYDGIEQLALGKRAVVFSARSRKHKVPVVIKVLLPHLAGEPRFLERFARDVQAATGLRHESLVNVLEWGRSEKTHFVVTERYEGTSLEEILSQHPRVPTPIALSIVLHVAMALEAVHARSLVHRDVRPANIIVTEDGCVKLSNLALATDLGEKGRVTHAGKVTATPAYMSPEQTRGLELDPRSDIFSLGSVAYELLSGRRAFGKGDFADILERVQAGTVTPLASINPVIEAPFDRMVTRMLSPELSERYEHVSEVVMDLEEAMDKYGYPDDAGALAAWHIDPPGYTGAYATALLEKLTARRPVGEGGSTPALLRYYEKVAYLDPGDEGARKEVERLRRERGTRETARAAGPPAPEAIDDSPAVRFGRLDPSAQYRVILESFDSARENEASFALRLSMKLRTPLPRMRSIVRTVPSRIYDRIPYKRALQLAKSIEEIGGRVRLDVCPDDNAVPADSPAAPAPETTRGGVTCPACGTELNRDAEYCPLCYQRFRPRETLTAKLLRERSDVAENPLSDEPARRFIGSGLVEWLVALPRAHKIAGITAAVLFVIFLLFR